MKKEKLQVRRKPALPENFKPVQEFEVLIEKVKIKYIGVRLVDLTDLTRPDEGADIRIDSIPEADREKIHKGLIFYWGIGQYTDQLIAKDNYVFDFEYAGRWTKEEIRRARREAREIYETWCKR